MPDACPPHDRPLIATALYTGLRISELLGLVWEDIDLCSGVIHLRAQLSRARHGRPARRVAPKTRAAIRDIPLTPQLQRVLREHRRCAQPAGANGWVFLAANGTPHGHRNVQRRALQRAAQDAGLNDECRPALRFHGLRHTFASHLIVDLGLDVVQVSAILGHAHVTTTLDVYSHLFDDARHHGDIRARMAASPFAALLQDAADENVIALPAAEHSGDGRLTARERAARRWGT